MKNNLFKNAVELFKSGKLDWAKDKFCVALTSGDYIPNFKTDTKLSDVPDEAFITSSGLDGVCIADSLVFRKVSGDKLIEAILIYTAHEDASSPLLVGYIGNSIGLPACPNGGDIFINWRNGDNKMFSTNWDGYTYD